jgi:hypothetical protein
MTAELRREKENTLAFFMGILDEDMELIDTISDMTDEELEDAIQYRLKI